MTSKVIPIFRTTTNRNQISSRFSRNLDHEVFDFLNSIIRKIAKKTKQVSGGTWKGFLALSSWLGKKMQEGAEIHRRQIQMLDDRHIQNFYHVRAL